MNSLQGLASRFGAVSAARWIVLAFALLATLAKLIIASRTFGTNDVHYWTAFAGGAHDFGPVGMYANAAYGGAPYNHAPLTGYLLVVLDWLASHTGLSFPFLIRVPASVADAVTALIVFELVRQIRPIRVAAISGVLVAWSPVLMIVSGFHGNTDPVMMMFALLSVLLATKGRYEWSGLAIGIALSIKLIPVMLLPLLLVVVIRAGWKPFARWAAGGLAVFAVLWVPVLVGYGDQFMTSVVGYKGIDVRQWGFHQFGEWASINQSYLTAYVDVGRLIVLALAASVPAWLVWRRKDAIVPATGLAFTGFLLLSSAFSMQYLVWPAIAAYLVGPWVGTILNAAAAVFAVSVYNSWNGGARFWDWYEGKAHMFESRHLFLMAVAWEALAIVVIVGLIDQFRHRQPPPTVSDQAADSVAGSAPLTVGASRL